MKTPMASLAIVTAALCGAVTAGAQIPPPPPAPPGAVPPPAYGTSAAQVASGRIKQFLINPNGDVDGLLLVDGTQVNFPPHLTTALLQIVRTGDLVTVQGVRGANGGAIHASIITNGTTQRSLADQPPSPDRPPPAPPALTALSAEGRVVQLLHADMGELNGAILDDGTIVRWPPPFGAQLQSVLAPSASLKASGYGSQNSYGRAIEATALSVNGQASMTVYGPGPAPGRVPPPPPAAPNPPATP